MTNRVFTYVLVHSLGFIFCSGILAQEPLDPDRGWKDLAQNLRVSRLILEPIIYEAGPDIDPNVHAYFTFKIMPGNEVEYLNARLTDPSTGISLWIVENVTLPPIVEPEIISYTINVEAFGPEYNFLRCEYNVSNTGQADSQFPSMGSVDLVPTPTVYNVPSGSDDPALSISDVSTVGAPIGLLPGLGGLAILRGLFMPNIDLDYSKDRTDSMACGPAAAANSLHWLVRQHKELAHETSSVRAKLDSLKKYMNRGDKIGVRFDSMVVGKLTLIDKLKLPISVKYKTKHESGNTDKPLASTEPPAHTADNQGKLGEHPDLDWIKKEIDDGEDVEVHVGWYGPPGKDGKRQRLGGHWLVATGYSTAKGNKGIYLKDDEVQGKPGGMRHKFYKWDNLPGGEPYLKDLKDSKGNIAIVESAVSESYDPTVTFEEEVSGPIREPWSDVTLTGERMKPRYAFLVPDNSTFPWIPIIGAVVAAGVVTYIVTQDNNNPSDCDFTVSSQITPSTCELPNGAITISVTPADQYEFVWSNGSTNNSLQNVVTGNYSVTITRTGTDCNVILPLTVTNSNTTFTATITTEDSECGLQNGSAIVNVNPAADYTYSWSNGGSTGPTQNDMPPGNYFVVVSLGGACADDYPVSIGELPPTFEITVTTTPSACGESDGTGTIQVTPDGNYEYAWSNTSTGSQVSGLAAGEYSITVSIPGTQCSKTITTTVEELPPNFEITTTTTPSGCSDSTGTANIAIEPSGTYDITWSNGITGSQATGLAGGEYQVTVTIAGTSCSKTTTVSITALPPSFVITSTTTPSECSDSTGTANITIDPSGTYDIVWSNGITGSQVTGLAEGEYQVTVTIAGTSCSKTTNVSITELPPSFVITSTTTPSGCSDSTGTANITIDPPGIYDITWSNGMTGPQVTGLAMGEYQVTVTIAGTSCSITTTITITELPPSFVISSATTPSGCTDSTGTATITVDPSGQYDIMWSNGLTGPQVTGLAAGDYTVTVTISGTMCSNTATVTVGQSGVEFTGTISVDTADCGVANGSATIVIDPEGSYTMVWSNQQTGPIAEQLIAGNYSVVVTDINGCSSSFSTTVEEDPAEYISIVNTIPGTCIGGGEITFTLTTPGTGPLNLQITGPEGSVSLILVSGTYLLSTLMNVLPGDYLFTVNDQVIGPMCTEIVGATVMNNTPLPEALDDFYDTPGGISITSNALDNDSGLNLEMTMIANIFGGTVVFNSSGEFTFTPDPGFSGDASFTYIVIDACGLTDTAVVTIFVEEVICDFNLDVTTIPASCGFDDGSISVDVIEPGTYAYIWDTGDSGPVITNIFAGSYTVTVEDVNLGCSLEFTIDLPENPADYIDNIVVTQPTCIMEGEISFDVLSPGAGQLTMVVDHPNGIEAFNIDEGTVFLSDYVSIVTGLYTIEVSNPEAGPDCLESFSVDILQPSTIQIVVEAVIPPSTPTAEDGAIVVVVTVPGEVPYTVLLNGIPVLTTTQNNFIIEGIGAGNYTVQIFDNMGCLSNILEVDVPFPDIILSFGSGVIHTGPYTSIPEQSLTDPISQWNSCLITSLQFFIGDKSQEVRFLYATPTQKKNSQVPRFNFLTLDFLTEISKKEWKKISVKLQGGIGINYVPQTHSSLLTEPQHWTLRGNLNRKIGKHLNLQCSASLMGWEKIDPPVIDFSLSILFPKLIRKSILVD